MVTSQMLDQMSFVRSLENTRRPLLVEAVMVTTVEKYPSVIKRSYSLSTWHKWPGGVVWSSLDHLYLRPRTIPSLGPPLPYRKTIPGLVLDHP